MPEDRGRSSTSELPAGSTAEDLLNIRVRGKVLVFHRSVLGYLVCAAFSVPLLWRQWVDGPLQSSDRVLLLISLGALVVCEGLIAHRLYSLCTDGARATVDRWARSGTEGVTAARVVAGGVGGVSLVLLGLSMVEVGRGVAHRSVLLAAAAIGLTGLTGLVYAARFRARVETQGPTQAQREHSSGSRPELVIACSGGGIRSAAFCLGALQRLRRREGSEKSLYERADAVYSVSGGGYIATGLHVSRHHSPGFTEDVFMPGSPEEDRLRRTSSYLMATARDRTLGVLSLLFGLTVNLVLLLAVLALLAWWMASWLRDSRALAEYTTWFPQSGTEYGVPAADAALDVDALPTWVQWSVWVPIGAVGLFVLHKLLVRVFHASRPPYRIPAWAAATSRTLDAAVPPLALAGVAAAALLLGTPWTIAQVSTATIHNEPTVSFAGVTARLGFASTAACRTAAEQSFRTSRTAAVEADQEAFDYGACGKHASSVPVSLTSAQCKDVDPTRDNAMATDCAGFVKDVGSASALGGAAALLTGLTGIVGAILRAPKRLPTGLVTSAGAWLRTRLLPWVGAALVVVVATVGFLKMTFDLALRDPFDRPAVFERTDRLWAAAVAILLVKLVADATSSSLHPFYRRRLSDTFLLQREGNGLTRPVPYTVPTLVSTTPPESGPGPALVICGAANVSDPEFIPTQRECSPFRFATAGPRGRAAAIGLSDTWRLPQGMRPAAAYEEAADPYRRDATMAAAMAISGAAISPRTGRANHRSRPYRLLLALANARLGVWLPNPYWVEEQPQPSRLGRQGATGRLVRRLRTPVKFVKTFSSKPGPFRLVKEAIGTSSIYDRRIYVTDGGHYDNTALVEALRDHPERLIVIDASNDAENTFSALGDAVATARMDLGLEIELEGLDALVSTADKRADKAWVSGTARPLDGTASGETTDVQIIKAIMFQDGLPLDLETYHLQHPDFPRTSTGDQLYGEYDFEAYRCLGYAAMDRGLEEFALPREKRVAGALGEVETHASTGPSRSRGAATKKRRSFGTARAHSGPRMSFRPRGASARPEEAEW